MNQVTHEPQNQIPLVSHNVPTIGILANITDDNTEDNNTPGPRQFFINRHHVTYHFSSIHPPLSSIAVTKSIFGGKRMCNTTGGATEAILRGGTGVGIRGATGTVMEQ